QRRHPASAAYYRDERRGLGPHAGCPPARRFPRVARGSEAHDAAPGRLDDLYLLATGLHRARALRGLLGRQGGAHRVHALAREGLAKASGGQLTVDVFPAMQLGGAAENVQNVRAGTLQMIWVGMAFLSRTVPELEAISLPFQFESREQAFRVVDGPVGKLLDAKFADKGLTDLGFLELGGRR